MAESVSNERLSAPDVRSIYTIKALGLLSLLLLQWLLKWFVSPTVLASPESVVILCALLPNLVVALWRGEVPLSLIGLSFAGDIAALSIGIHYAGGADQVSAPLLYCVIIGLAGLILSGRAAFLAAAGSLVGYNMVVWGEYRGLLPHHLAYQRPPDRQIATAIMVSIYLSVFAWLVSYAFRQVRAIYRRLDELRTEAVSALAHDLKNPLGAIRVYGQMLHTTSTEDVPGHLAAIDRSARQAFDLVQNVLDASAMERRMVDPKREPVRADELVEGVVEQYRSSAEAKGITLAIEIERLPVVALDTHLIGRAIENLISNAIKYSERGGHVGISAKSSSDAILVGVKDDGCGISESEREKLFQAWGRAGSARQAREGTGLGLYIVRRIAEAHGGNVSLQSEVGKGSTFRLSLPLTGEPLKAVVRAAAESQGALRDDARLPRPNVRAIYVAQAAGLTGILAVVWILKVFVSPTTLAEPISVVILVVLVPILSVTLWPTEIPAWLWVASFGTSVAGTTAGIHFGGGVDQVSGPLLYCVILGLAGLILSPRAAFVVAAWSVAAYACLVWLEYEGWLPHRVAYSRPPDRQLATVIMVGICLFIFASLVSYTVRQIRRTYRRAEDLRREAVSALSSSLKTPLAMIRDAVGSIKAEPAKPSVANDPAVLRIESSAQEAIDLVHNVLDASAIEQAGITPRREPVELDGLLTHIVDLYRPSADLRRMRLVTDLARELPPVSLDVALFGRALGNVLSAALGATRPGENVLISSGRSERGPFVAVCCERAVSPTGEPGLRLARSILEAHGASLETLLDGKGRAAIRLALPTAEETVDSLASRTSIRGQRTTSARCERL